MDIEDENGNKVSLQHFEVDEQELARFLIEESDIVLELGARYGSVSCIINSKLKCKTNQVSVEPDDRIWAALERNKKVNNCDFHIVKGFVSKKKLGLIPLGYATTSIEQEESTIPSYSLEAIQEKYNLKFNVLVADCEGFLETFFDENPEFIKQLRVLTFEADYPDKCNYTKIKTNLMNNGFVCHLDGFQNVWYNSLKSK